MTLVRTVGGAAPCAPSLALSLLLALSPAPARAQEEIGLDLTEATMDLRPTLAVVGVDLAEGNPKRDAWILTYIGTMLSTNAAKSNFFISVMKPEEAAAKLGDKYAAALKCGDDACMVELATALGVERVITAQASHGATDSGLKLNVFTSATGAVQSATVEVKGPPRGDFFKKTVVVIKPLLQSLSGKLAHLKVEPSLDSAKVTLGDRVLGTGTVDVKVSAGTFLLKATAEGFEGQQQVVLQEGGSADLQLAMVPVREAAPTKVASAAAGKPPASSPSSSASSASPSSVPSTSAGSTPAIEGPTEEDRLAASASRVVPSGPRSSGPPLSLDGLLKHPGTYMGVGGVVAIVVGSGLGVAAMGIKGRAVDANRDGVLDVTRNEVVGAQTQALIANVLFAAGALSLAGGGTWLFVSPPKGGGVAVSAGGKF